MQLLYVLILFLALTSQAFGADAKISALTADGSPTTDDLLITVDDPAGTPVNKKATIGNVVGAANAATATALAADGANCSAGSFPLGVDASGAAQGCTDAATQAELDAHTGDATAAHNATAIEFTPSGNLEATDVDGAIQELDTEKAPLAAPTFTGASRISGTLESDAVSPSQISGNQDDYAGCAGKVVCRLDTDGGHTITSFAGGGNWRWLFVVNIGSNEFILDHDAATGTAANRINATTGTDLTINPGEAALLVYDNTTSRWRATKFGVVVASEADTLDTVFDRGKVIDGASSFANAVRFTDSSGDGIAIYRDATNGPVVTCIVSTVENDCDKVVKLNANKVWKITDDADGTIVQVSEAGVTTYGSSYRPRKSIWFGADALYGDGTQCPAAPTAVTINSGPIVPTFICADNDGSSLYGSIKMPDSWDGGTVTFTHVYLQTAADTNALNGDIACQARSNGEAPSSTWGTEVAIDDAGVTGSNQNDMTTSAAATCAGTGVAGGDVLYFRYQLDAAGTTTAVATLHHVGFMMEYSASGLSD